MYDDYLTIDIPIAKPGIILESGKMFNLDNYNTALNHHGILKFINAGRLVLVKEITPEMEERERKLLSIIDNNIKANRDAKIGLGPSLTHYFDYLYIHNICIVRDWKIGSIKVKCETEENYDYIKKLLSNASYIAKHHVLGCVENIDGIDNMFIEYLLGFALF